MKYIQVILILIRIRRYIIYNNINLETGLPIYNLLCLRWENGEGYFLFLYTSFLCTSFVPVVSMRIHTNNCIIINTGIKLYFIKIQQEQESLNVILKKLKQFTYLPKTDCYNVGWFETILQ